MATPEITTAVKIDVGVTGDGSVKSIKTELKEAKADAIAMARAFGENSKEANLAAQKVANLKDEIEDLGLKIKAVNPDKFQRIATLVQGVASGFAAATGAMTLFGSESEELNKTMIKLQSVIAISEGVQGFTDFLKSASPLMIALSIAVTTLVLAWDSLTAAIYKSEEAEKAALKTAIDNSEMRIKMAELDGEDVYIMRLDQMQKRIQLLKAEGAEKIEIEKATDEWVLFMYAHNAAETKKIDEKIKKDEADLLALRKKQAEDFAAFQEKQRIEAERLRDAGAVEAKRIFDAEQDVYTRQLQIDYKREQESAQVKIDAEKKAQDEKQKAREQGLIQAQKALDDELAAEKRLQDAKRELVSQGFQAISDLAYLFANKSEEQQKKAFEIQKAASIASAIVNSLESAVKSYNSLASIPVVGVGLGLAAATAALIAGAAQVKKIQQTEFQSTAQSAPSSYGGGIQAPSINQSPQQQRQVISNATGSTGTIKQTNAVKVYVTETDISKSQNRVGEIRRRALIK